MDARNWTLSSNTPWNFRGALVGENERPLGEFMVTLPENSETLALGDIQPYDETEGMGMQLFPGFMWSLVVDVYIPEDVRDLIVVNKESSL